MKNMIITDGVQLPPGISGEVFDIRTMAARDCRGCWSCWWKTPGRCIYKDLDEYYRAYVHAEKAVFFAKTVRGFVSGGLKSLFDRMLPLYLPYIEYSTGESMHVTRYPHYPDIEFYYEGSFETADGRSIFEDYIHRVFYQFHSQKIQVRPIEEFDWKGGAGD